MVLKLSMLRKKCFKNLDWLQHPSATVIQVMLIFALLIITILTLNIYLHQANAGKKIKINDFYTSNSNQSSIRTIMFDLPSKQIKDKNNSVLEDSVKQLLLQANLILPMKPTSVVDKKQLPTSGDIHDFISLAPYCWPDSSKPKGLPYVCHDGMLNPESNFYGDKIKMADMIKRVKTLSLAYYFTDNVSYASKATELLRVWFLNNDTRMNPNLNHGEVTPGKNNGNHRGIIAAKDLPETLDSIQLIQSSPVWTKEDQTGMKLWFSKYLDWLLTSKPGKLENQTLNNHGTWYDVQASSIALFLNKPNVTNNILQKNVNNLIPEKIKSDGSEPFELERRESLDYSMLNLLGLYRLANIGENVGINLWNYKTDEGAGLQKALDYLLPYLLKKTHWPYAQVVPINKKLLVGLLCQATTHYNNNESYMTAYQSLNLTDITSNVNNLAYKCSNYSS